MSTFIGVVAARAINATTKVKTSDLTNKHAFAYRVIKRIDKALNCGETKAREYLRLAIGINDYERRKSLQGLGGCTPLTLKQALKEADL